MKIVKNSADYEKSFNRQVLSLPLDLSKDFDRKLYDDVKSYMEKEGIRTVVAFLIHACKKTLYSNGE